MGSQVGTYPYNYDAPSANNGSDQFERLGHPGKYYSVITHTTGQLDLTGSNYGYGSIIVNNAGSTTITLSGGGTIPAANLTAGVIYELSVSKLSGSSGAVIYVLKKQGI
jgi:hypothetical protein